MEFSGGVQEAQASITGKMYLVEWLSMECRKEVHEEAHSALSTSSWELSTG